MMKKLLSVVLVSLSVTTMFAEPITKQKALNRAKDFLAKKGIVLSEQAARMSYAPIRGVKEELQPYYIFNNGNDEGFVVLSGDDNVTPVLGYTSEGNFDPNNMPDNMRGWLDNIERELKYIQENNLSMRKTPIAGRVSTAPMVTSKWGQGAPYNNKCPFFPNGGRVVVGCVATAMAQAMYCLRDGASPEVTETIPGYTCRTDWGGGKYIEVAEVAKGSKLEWDKMVDSYAGTVAPSKKTAVANLMYYCGAAVKMEYATAEKGGSGAVDSRVANALKKYFGYSQNTRYVVRNSFTIDGWEKMIYDEVTAGRPVIFGGTSSAGSGHCFVVDGYNSETGMFTLNWGWNGYCDGEFMITALAPEEGGIGAGTILSGYNFMQDAIIGLDSRGNGEYKPQTFLTTIDRVTPATIYTTLWNANEIESGCTVALCYYDENNQLQQVDATKPRVASLRVGYYSQPTYNLSRLTTQMPNGIYRMVPGFMMNKADGWQTTCEPDKYVEVEVKDGKFIISGPKLSVESIDVIGEHFAKLDHELKFSVKNEGAEFSTEVYLFVSASKTFKGVPVAKTILNVKKGETEQLSIPFIPTATGKNYIIVTADEGGHDVIAETSVVFNKLDVPGPFYVTSITLNNELRREKRDGSTIIYINDEEVNGKVGVTNVSSKSYYGTFSLSIGDNQRSWDISGFSAGAKYNIPVSGIRLEEKDKEYPIILTAKDGVCDEHYKVVLVSPTGISHAQTAEDGVFNIYTINGVRVKQVKAENAEAAMQGLAKGLYIVNGMKYVVK